MAKNYRLRCANGPTDIAYRCTPTLPVATCRLYICDAACIENGPLARSSCFSFVCNRSNPSLLLFAVPLHTLCLLSFCTSMVCVLRCVSTPTDNMLIFLRPCTGCMGESSRRQTPMTKPLPRKRYTRYDAGRFSE